MSLAVTCGPRPRPSEATTLGVARADTFGSARPGRTIIGRNVGETADAIGADAESDTTAQSDTSANGSTSP